MTQRLFLLPVIVVAIMQLGVLLRTNPAWFAAQITQWIVVLLAAAGGWLFEQDRVWVGLAWGLCIAFMLLPSWMNRRAMRCQAVGLWTDAIRWRRWTGPFIWGHQGKLHRAFTRVLSCLHQMKFDEANRILEELAQSRLPAPVVSAIALMRHYVPVVKRDWHQVLAMSQADGYRVTGSDAEAVHLMAARALAELGDIGAALDRMRRVMQIPIRSEAVELSLWHTRVAVSALAGDTGEMERLLQHRGGIFDIPRLERVAEYWRARCAFARGEPAAAEGHMARARALTNEREPLWQAALEGASWTDAPTRDPAAHVAARNELRRLEHQTGAWSALMQLGRAEPSTIAMILVLTGVLLVERHGLDSRLRAELWQHLANASETILTGECWRALTALFIHAGWAHLGMNALGLWVLGSALQQSIGRWRMWTVFVLGGMAGNFTSAVVNLLRPLRDRYDISVGASSGIFALIGAYTVAVASLRGDAYTPARGRVLVFLAVILCADFATVLIEPRVDFVAHVGGFCGGLAVALLLARRTATALPAQRGAP